LFVNPQKALGGAPWPRQAVVDQVLQRFACGPTSKNPKAMADVPAGKMRRIRQVADKRACALNLQLDRTK